MQIKSRAVTAADADQICRIENSSFAVPWSKESILHDLEQNPASRWIVLEDETGEVLAYAGLWLVIDEGHILKVAVRPDMRGAGLGKRIVKDIIEMAWDEGMRLLLLEVRRSNIAAQNLYHSCGFLDVGYRKKYYQDNHEDALIMYMDRPEDREFHG